MLALVSEALALPAAPYRMIQISGLHFRYAEGDFSLDVPSLRVEAAETLAVVGPSGSGKTTLLNLIAGIALPQRGHVVTNGTEVSALDDGRRRDFRIANIGLVFQEFELLEYLSVLDNILMPYRINAHLRLDAAARDRARRLAGHFEIEDKLERHPNHLSQGERQRVAVCRALVVEPPLLLADEPTGNLDPRNKMRVLDRLFDYARDRGATLVTVTHDHDLLSRFGRVVDFQTFHGVTQGGLEEPVSV